MLDNVTEQVMNGAVIGIANVLPGPTLDEIKRMYIEDILSRSKSLQEAATVLGIDLSTLWRKRKRHNMIIQGYRTVKRPALNQKTILSNLILRVGTKSSAETIGSQK